jgi:hypothetical protein
MGGNEYCAELKTIVNMADYVKTKETHSLSTGFSSLRTETA